MNSFLSNTVSLVMLTVSFLAPAEAFAGSYSYSRTYIRHTTTTTTRAIAAPVAVAQVAPCRQVYYQPCRVKCRPCRRVVFRPCGGRRVRCFY